MFKNYLKVKISVTIFISLIPSTAVHVVSGEYIPITYKDRVSDMMKILLNFYDKPVNDISFQTEYAPHVGGVNALQ